VLDVLRPALVVGGETDWNAPNALPANFVPNGFSDEPLAGPAARYWKAMTSGGSTGRPKVILDHQPAVVDTSAEPALGMPFEVALLNPAPLYHDAPFIVSHFCLFTGGHLTGLVKFDAEETLRLIESNRVQWVNFVPTMMHRIWALPDEMRNRYDLSSLKVVFHMAAPMPPLLKETWLKEKCIEWLGPERIYELYGGTERQGRTVISGVEWLAHRGSVGKIDPSCGLRIIGADGNDVAPGESGEICFLPADGAGCTYHYLGAEPKRRADDWESLGDIGRLDADGLSLSRRSARRHDPARRREHLSGPRSRPRYRRIRICAPASACQIPNSDSASTPSSNSTTQPMRKPSPLTWDTSWLIGSAAPSILKVSRSSAPACATIPARSAAPCCATGARHG
jgi:bile acid-coenzyme A ligase